MGKNHNIKAGNSFWHNSSGYMYIFIYIPLELLLLFFLVRQNGSTIISPFDVTTVFPVWSAKSAGTSPFHLINKDPKLRELNGWKKCYRNFKKFCKPFIPFKGFTRKCPYDVCIITFNNCHSTKRLIFIRKISTWTFVTGIYFFLDLSIVSYFIRNWTTDRFFLFKLNQRIIDNVFYVFYRKHLACTNMCFLITIISDNGSKNRVHV